MPLVLQWSLKAIRSLSSGWDPVAMTTLGPRDRAGTEVIEDGRRGTPWPPGRSEHVATAMLAHGPVLSLSVTAAAMATATRQHDQRRERGDQEEWKTRNNQHLAK